MKWLYLYPDINDIVVSINSWSMAMLMPWLNMRFKKTIALAVPVYIEVEAFYLLNFLS